MSASYVIHLEAKVKFHSMVTSPSLVSEDVKRNYSVLLLTLISNKNTLWLLNKTCLWCKFLNSCSPSSLYFPPLCSQMILHSCSHFHCHSLFQQPSEKIQSFFFFRGSAIYLELPQPWLFKVPAVWW